MRWWGKSKERSPDTLPGSRPSVILSKVTANSLGVLTMVAGPGLFAYGLFCYYTKTMLDPLPFRQLW
jgi:hypothetical protein